MKLEPKSIAPEMVLELATRLQTPPGDNAALSELRQYLVNPDSFLNDFTLALAQYVWRWHSRESV